VILIGSGEHYGAVCNLDFDFHRYLRQLQTDGLNITRVFTGAAYVEPQGAFDIERNTLAPPPGRYLAPWARSHEAGAWDGGTRWDLERWDEAYFRRFRDFATEAERLTQWPGREQPFTIQLLAAHRRARGLPRRWWLALL
jgi:hypothetical protein